MEAYYSSYSSSSSSSSSSSTYLTQSPQLKNPKQSQPFHTSLRSVRKLPAKPWKKHIAPLPPTPPRVYKVEPKNFRELVQKLTGASEFLCGRLQSVAPPPLNLGTLPPLPGSDISAPLELLSSPQKTPLSTALYQNLMSETLDTKPQKLSDSLAESNPFGLSLSPSSYTWFSFPLMSPGTLSGLEQSTVL